MTATIITRTCTHWCDLDRTGDQHDDDSPHCEGQVAGVEVAGASWSVT